MATITTVSASPTAIAPGGGKSIITTSIVPSVKTATVTIRVDGGTGTGQINVHEPIVYSINAADVGKRGYVVATVDQGGKLELGSTSGTFVFTAN